MTVTEFTGVTLPDGWTAVAPAGSSVDMPGDYLQLTIDPNQTFDSTTSSSTGPEGPLVWYTVSGAFDYAVCLAEEAINLNTQGLDLIAIDNTMLGGIRLSNYRNNTGAHRLDCGWYVFGENAGTVVNTSGDGLMNGLYGGPGWLRMAWDGVNAWTVYGSMTGFSGSWNTIASFTDAFTPTRFAIHAIAFPSGAAGRVQRIQRVVDLIAVGSDDATTDPPTRTEADLYEEDFAGGSLPAWLTAQTNNGGTVATTTAGAELSVGATDQSYAWLVGPTDLPIDGHGIEIEFQLTSAGGTNHFWVPVIALESSTDIAGAQVHNDKWGTGDGLLLEMSAREHAVAGATIRTLRTSPNDTGSSPTGNREFDTYTLLVEDTSAPVTTVGTPLTRLKMERLDNARLRAKFWYAANSEPSAWDYEVECRMRHGTGMGLTLSHNDGAGGTSSVRFSYIRVYKLASSVSASAELASATGAATSMTPSVAPTAPAAAATSSAAGTTTTISPTISMASAAGAAHAATVTATPLAASVGSGWDGLLSIVAEAIEERRRELFEPPVACPNDGTLLEEGPHGSLHCRFDGYLWPRDQW